MKKKRRWLIGIGIGVVVAIVAIFIAASIIAKRFEPMIRDQAIAYMSQRFHCEVELAALHIHVPHVSTFDLILHRESGIKVRVDGDKLSMRFPGSSDLPPLFSIRKFGFVMDLGSLAQDQKVVDSVSLEGMQINVPPKGERHFGGNSGDSGNGKSKALIRDVRVRDAVLVLLPKDKGRNPLRFQIERLHLTSAGTDTAMNYDATLTNPKPPGKIDSKGTFGPWAADEPGDTPLNGKYTFDHADLGIFNGIAGILSSTGTFDGTLSSVHARGQARVPDFRLKMAGNPVPLSTTFEVLVDGTNGNTILQPVHAKLGSTEFTTKGAVIKHEDKRKHLIDLKVAMPDGSLRDLLRLAVKGSPFMEGRISLNTTIDIPPLTGTVKEKLRLNGKFSVHDAKFLRSNIQDQIDKLSRKGQGQPKNGEIDEVISSMSGAFRLENQRMTFSSLTFGVPGAHIRLAGAYDMGQDTLDFHGTVRLHAKVSQTMTGWKRWALKPVDPFFAKHGAGTFLHIKVEGSAHKPDFGLDH
jgi:hypothetical protein